MRPRPTQKTDGELHPSTVSLVTTCLKSAHALLDNFLWMDVFTLRSIPVIVYTRMFYAVVVLTKLAVCAKSPESIVGAILDPGSLKTPEYLHKLIDVLTKAAGPESFSVSSTFLTILAKLTEWYRRLQLFSPGIEESEEILVPMAYLKIEQDPVKTGHLATANSFDSITDEESISFINAFPNEIQFYKQAPSDFEMVYGDLSSDFATLGDYNPTGELDHSIFLTLLSTESSQLNTR
jgi:hypothetical protein